jgi:hypothetical protein
MKAEFLKARKRWEAFNKENDIEVEVLWEHNPEHSDEHFMHYVEYGTKDMEKIVALWSDKVDGSFTIYKY